MPGSSVMMATRRMEMVATMLAPSSPDTHAEGQRPPSVMPFPVATVSSMGRNNVMTAITMVATVAQSVLLRVIVPAAANPLSAHVPALLPALPVVLPVRLILTVVMGSSMRWSSATTAARVAIKVVSAIARSCLAGSATASHQPIAHPFAVTASWLEVNSVMMATAKAAVMVVPGIVRSCPDGLAIILLCPRYVTLLFVVIRSLMRRSSVIWAPATMEPARAVTNLAMFKQAGFATGNHPPTVTESPVAMVW